MADSSPLEDADGNPYTPQTQAQYEDADGKPYFIKNPQNLSVQQNPESATLADKFRHYIGRYVPGLLSAGGALAGGAATEGLGGEALGAAGGSFLGQGLQKDFPRLFGAPQSNTLGDGLTQAATDAVGNAVVPAAGKGLVNAFTSKGVNLLASPLLQKAAPVQKALGEVAEQEGMDKVDALLAPNKNVLSTAAANTAGTAKALRANIRAAKPTILQPASIDEVPLSGSVSSPEMTAALTKYSQTFGSNEVGKDLLKLRSQIIIGKAGSQEYNDIAKTAMSDLQHVKNLKIVAGPAVAEQLGVNEVIGKGYSPTAGTIDPDKILKAFDGDKSDVYDEAISVGTKQNIANLMSSIKDAQTQQAKGTPYNGLLNYAKHRLVFEGAMMTMGAAAGESVGHMGPGILGGGAIVLGDAAIAKLMSNPTTAKAVVAAVKSPKTAAQSSMLSKVIQNGLRGSYVMYQGPEDKLEKAYVDENGQLTYQKPTQK